MTNDSDLVNDESVDPFALTSSHCSTQLSGSAYYSAVFVGLAVATLSWVIGVLVLWATVAMLFISRDSFEPRQLVLGQLTTFELASFVIACIFVLAVSIFLGLRSKRRVENGWNRTSRIEQRKNELGEQLLAVRADLRSKDPFEQS